MTTLNTFLAGFGVAAAITDGEPASRLIGLMIFLFYMGISVWEKRGVPNGQ